MIHRGILVIGLAACTLLFASCEKMQELITATNWVGNWMMVQSGTVGSDSEAASLIGTIKVKQSDKSKIVISGGLFGLEKGIYVEAQVKERTAEMELLETETFRLWGMAQLKNADQIRFTYTVESEEGSLNFEKVAVKV